MDCELGIKHGLGVKRGLWTMYIKTALERLQKKTERNAKRTSKNSFSPSFNIPFAVHMVYSSHGQESL